MNNEILEILEEYNEITYTKMVIVQNYINDLIDKNNKFEQTLSTIGDTIKPMVSQNEKLLDTNDKLNKIINDSEVTHLERIAIAVEKLAYNQKGY